MKINTEGPASLDYTELINKCVEEGLKADKTPFIEAEEQTIDLNKLLEAM